MSFSRPLTHVLSPSDAPLLFHVICHQKLNSEFAPVQFFSPHCAAALWQIKFSYLRSLEQRNSSIMYGLRSEILFPLLFLCLNLCMSLWFRCSRTAVQRQSSTKRWNEKAVWGDIEAQANSTPGWSELNTNVFLPFWIPVLFLDAGGNEDVEMASQNPGINAVTAGEGCSVGVGAWGSVHIRWRKVRFDWRAVLGLTAA